MKSAHKRNAYASLPTATGIYKEDFLCVSRAEFDVAMWHRRG